jgi:hypothetical protein
MDNQVLDLMITAGQFRNRLQEAKRNFLMMSYNGFFADPVQSWHSVSLFSLSCLCECSGRRRGFQSSLRSRQIGIYDVMAFVHFSAYQEPFLFPYRVSC